MPRQAETRNARTKLSPPQLARRLGISAEKVIHWITRGELKAFNAATDPGGRPRWLIDEADIAIFEAARSATVATAPRQQQRRRRQAADYVRFEY